MAFTTTTLAAAALVTDRVINVTSTTGFLANQLIRIDNEFMLTLVVPTTGTLITVARGVDGTTTTAHPKTANVTTGLATDFAQPPVGTSLATIDPAQPAFPINSYSAAGAITVVQQIAVINGTSGLAMTIAAPTADQDGQIVIVISNGKAAHTLAVSGNNGVGNAGAGYRTLTFAAGGKQSVWLIACNGDWVQASTYLGTTTNVGVTLS